MSDVIQVLDVTFGRAFACSSQVGKKISSKYDVNATNPDGTQLEKITIFYTTNSANVSIPTTGGGENDRIV